MSTDDSGIAILLLEMSVRLYYCQIAASIVVLYEYAATFSQEVRFVWCGKANAVALLFALNRYTTLVGAFAYLLNGGLFIETITSCKAINSLLIIPALSVFAVWAVFSALRVYVISSRNRWLMAVTLLLGLVPVATNLVTLILTSYAIAAAPIGCVMQSRLPFETATKLFIVTRVCAIASDCIVISVTWINTLKFGRISRRSSRRLASLMRLFSRDGTLYFLLLMLLNIAQLVTNNPAISDYLWPFLTQFPSIIISRMLLKICRIRMLAEDEAYVDRSESVQDGSMSSHPHFLTTFVGSVGLPFSVGSMSPVSGDATSRVERMA